MHRQFDPAGIARPVGSYSHGVEVPAGARWLHTAGQVGITPDGKIAQGFEAQCRAVFENLTAILKEAGMDWGDVVKVNSFITDLANLGKLREARQAYMGAAKPASTLLVVAGLASPEFLLEVEVIAAKA
jgi:enamine deaminase RidA (YjgF/YER057c/UK114 family)